MALFLNEKNKKINIMGIEGNVGIKDEDDDQAYKTNGSKSFEYSDINNINSKVKN